MTELGTELQTYAAKRDELLRVSEGKFVLIHSTNVLGIYDDRLAAVEAGHKQLGNVAFLTKQILREEPVVILATALKL